MDRRDGRHACIAGLLGLATGGAAAGIVGAYRHGRAPTKKQHRHMMLSPHRAYNVPYFDCLFYLILPPISYVVQAKWVWMLGLTIILVLILILRSSAWVVVIVVAMSYNACHPNATIVSLPIPHLLCDDDCTVDCVHS